MCSEGEFDLNVSYALKEADKHEQLCIEYPVLYRTEIDKKELEGIMLAVTYNNENKAGYLGCRVKTYGDLIATLRSYASDYK